jgi:DNA-binding MarR family transcriptional regulator
LSERQLAAKAPHQEAEPAPERQRRSKRNALELGVLQRHLGYFIRRLQLWVFQDLVRTLAEVDIRPAQYSVLAVIEANSGLSQADLAGFLGIERARLVRVLDLLEKRGLIRRLASESDRRSHALVLTRDGEKSLRRMKSLAAAHEAKLAERLGPENRKRMLAVLRNLDAAHRSNGNRRAR